MSAVETGRRPAEAYVLRPGRRTDAVALHALARPFVEDGSLRERPVDVLAAAAGDFVVAEGPHALIGCAGLRLFRTQDRPYLVLYNLCIDRPHQGRGWGGRLLAEGLRRRRASGAEAVYAASTRRDDWFLRRGFVRITPAMAPAPWVGALDPARHSRLYRRRLTPPGASDPEHWAPGGGS